MEPCPLNLQEDLATIQTSSRREHRAPTRYSDQYTGLTTAGSQQPQQPQQYHYQAPQFLAAQQNRMPHMPSSHYYTVTPNVGSVL